MGPYAAIDQADREASYRGEFRGDKAGPTVPGNIASANESLEQCKKHILNILARIRGASPEAQDRGDAPTRVGAASLMEQLERHARLINEFTSLIKQLEDYV